jgi:hypothetical protein
MSFFETARWARGRVVGGDAGEGVGALRCKVPAVYTCNWSRLAAAVRLRGTSATTRLALLAPSLEEFLRS